MKRILIVKREMAPKEIAELERVFLEAQMPLSERHENGWDRLPGRAYKISTSSHWTSSCCPGPTSFHILRRRIHQEKEVPIPDGVSQAGRHGQIHDTGLNARRLHHQTLQPNKARSPHRAPHTHIYERRLMRQRPASDPDGESHPPAATWKFTSIQLSGLRRKIALTNRRGSSSSSSWPNIPFQTFQPRTGSSTRHRSRRRRRHGDSHGPHQPSPKNRTGLTKPICQGGHRLRIRFKILLFAVRRRFLCSTVTPAAELYQRQGDAAPSPVTKGLVAGFPVCSNSSRFR